MDTINDTSPLVAKYLAGVLPAAHEKRADTKSALDFNAADQGRLPEGQCPSIRTCSPIAALLHADAMALQS
jgi:hypothetical protein